MTDLQRTASLHEKAVQKVAKGQVEPLRSTSRRMTGRSGEVSFARVHPAAMEAAQRALRPGTRIQVVSPTEVMIVNIKTDQSPGA
jgi:hypothetical protein